MPRPTITRRRALGLAGAGLAAGVGATGVVGATPGDDRAPLEVQQHSVEQATKKYRDLGTALEDGYEIMGPYVPDMGMHLVDFDRIERAAKRGINIRQPQGLTYNLEGTLGSVEYIVPLDEEPPDVFSDEHDEEHGWHAHQKAQHAFSNGNGEADDRDGIGVAERLNPENWIELTDQLPQFPAYDPDLSAGDTVEGLWGGTPPAETRTVDYLIEHGDWWTLHAWVHVENPEGVFASYNHSDDWDPLPAPPHDHGGH